MDNSHFTDLVFSIFSQLNQIPRPSHHEERVADFLCRYARDLGLAYQRDATNCVVIRKPATPGHEAAEPVVLLNHMDMVAVGDGSRPFDPLADGIDAYVEDGWMKAHGTSLGADNGIGLSMALAVLACDDLVHGPLEVLTTTNEEDGMTGAAALSADFIKGRKVINLDSEDFDTITIGAAGAYLQTALFPSRSVPAPDGLTFFRTTIRGGAGGHSGVDIGKRRFNAIHGLCRLLNDSKEDLFIGFLHGGSASASIATECTAVVGVGNRRAPLFRTQLSELFRALQHDFSDGDALRLDIEETEQPDGILAGRALPACIAALPCGVIRMHDDLPGTVMTSNNIGVIRTLPGGISLTCHTRSFSDEEMSQTAEAIGRALRSAGAGVRADMCTPSWKEHPESAFIRLTDNTFKEQLGFAPRHVAMHFVLEAGYYVRTFPGIEIACIGPRILSPHSAQERVELSTVSAICRVLTALLEKMA